MSNSILKGKKGIIFGALDSKSIAWKVAENCKLQGAVNTSQGRRNENKLYTRPPPETSLPFLLKHIGEPARRPLSPKAS